MIEYCARERSPYRDIIVLPLFGLKRVDSVVRFEILIILLGSVITAGHILFLIT